MPDRSHERPVFLLLGLLLAGCGGSDPSGGSGDPGGGTGGGESASAQLDPRALCSEVIALQCEGHIRCCDREADKYASAEECASLLEPLCVQDLSGAAYAGGQIRYSQQSFEQAMERLRGAVESCEPVGREILDDIFAGSVGEGGDCTPAVEQSDYSSLLACQDGLACIVREGSEERVCAPRAGEGEVCLDVDCAAGLFCGGGNEPVCRPLRAEGIGCTSHSECETGFCGDEERCATRTVAYRYCEDLTYP